MRQHGGMHAGISSRPLARLSAMYGAHRTCLGALPGGYEVACTPCTPDTVQGERRVERMLLRTDAL